MMASFRTVQHGLSITVCAGGGANHCASCLPASEMLQPQMIDFENYSVFHGSTVMEILEFHKFFCGIFLVQS